MFLALMNKRAAIVMPITLIPPPPSHVFSVLMLNVCDINAIAGYDNAEY
jgi:hypothetical protein